MSGIPRELWAFLTAILTGAGLVMVYEILILFRMIVKHRLWAVQIEDFIFWIAAGFFVFLQMFRTNYGNVRWYFVLGGGLGALTCGKLLSRANKYVEKKIKILKKRCKRNKINLSE